MPKNNIGHEFSGPRDVQGYFSGLGVTKASAIFRIGVAKAIKPL